MTQPLAPGSPRRVAAARFASELRKAMGARNASVKRLAEATGAAPSAIATWKGGDNLPRTDTAARLAEVLDWPRLVAIVREGRVGSCVRCGRSYTNEGGTPKRFCSSECREVDAVLRERQPVSALADAVRIELARVNGTTAAVSRRTLGAALTEYGRSEAKRVTRNRSLERRTATIQAAVDAMCAGCEPSGVCRTSACALRPVSPLPLALSDRHADELRTPEGPWGPNHRDAQLVAIRAANAARWARPGEREKASQAQLTRFATPELRAAHGRRVSVGRRRAIAEKSA